MKGQKTYVAKVGISAALKRDRETARNTPANIMPNIQGASIRTKKRGLRVYFYLVKHYWDGKKSLQKVLRYYGKEPPRKRAVYKIEGS